ncbi:hypothetical protein Tco_0074019 [Tanacetum coccineum]
MQNHHLGSLCSTFNNTHREAEHNKFHDLCLVCRLVGTGHGWDCPRTCSRLMISVLVIMNCGENEAHRFSKADGFHAVPPHITGNFLTPRADISFAGKTNEANTKKPKTVYESVNKDKVIIKDWNSDDEDDVSEVQTVSPVKTNETQTTKTRVDKIRKDIKVKKSKNKQKPTRNGKDKYKREI